MCGICGVVTARPITDKQIDQVKQMNEALTHRGPDGAGEFYTTNIALAMRRLSIIDLTWGWQPLYNEDHSLVLIANGEIYNFIELRDQLQVQGHRFKTGSDCETIVHLYEEYGVDCVQHLRGMFAFALWDAKCSRLMLARDRMGEKPLYLYEQEGMLFFASELKALLRSGVVEFALEPSAVDLYFHYNYVPEPGTIVKGVRKLNAAHFLVVNVELWQVEETCYWRMEDAPTLSGVPSQLIREELEQVSKLVIRSDVPVGIALSGGLDSSAVAALAARTYPGTMHAFSVGYPGHPRTDERTEAKTLADYLGLPFHDIELDTEAMVKFFPELVYWRDDPIADISGYGYYAVMKLAREHNVPVMLQGQGGDELFWGYSWVRKAVQESRQKAILWRKGWKALPNYICPARSDWLKPRALWHWAKNIRGPNSGWERFRRHRTSPAEQIIFHDVLPEFRQMTGEIKRLYTPMFINRLKKTQTMTFSYPQPWLQVGVHLTRLICETYLRENGITQGDRLSMASSIELRLPLVDHKLVETIIGLRKAQPDDDLPPKTWFKAALKGILPDWAIDRPKRGFEPPTREWRRAILKAYGNQLSNGYLVSDGILDLSCSHQLIVGSHTEGIMTPLSFKALVLEVWCRYMMGVTTGNNA